MTNSHLFKGLVLTLTLIFSTNLLAKPDFDERVTALIGEIEPRARVGLIVQDAKTGETLFERQANYAFIPASTTKLITSYTALHSLGADFKFKTSVMKDSDGALYLKFRGDPSFKTEDFNKLLKSIPKNDLTKASAFFIDNTYYENPVYSPGASVEDIHWYFTAPVTSVIINQNQLKIDIQPNKTINKPTTVLLLDENKKYFNLSSNIKTVSTKAAKEECQLLLDMDPKNNIKLGGCWPIEDKKTSAKLAVINPDRLAKQILLDYLKTHNQEKLVRFKKAPENAIEVATHGSEPLSQLIQSVLSDSNNIYSDSLVKQIGKKELGIASFQVGTRAMLKILKKEAAINTEALKLYDGSGISRYNLITPKQLNRILYTVLNSPHIKDHLIKGLARSGSKGTLSTRLTSFDLIDKISAKTGAMAGVLAISGYVQGKDNRKLIVTIMMNQSLLEGKAARGFQDELMLLIANNRFS